MTAIVSPNPRMWSGSRDSEGHRTYKVTWQVASAFRDGPANVMNAAGLPQPGAQWNLGLDSDLWAWCLADMTVESRLKEETNYIWDVTQTFTTKPPDTRRCINDTITDPLLIPPEISGDFVKYTEEACYDRFGIVITNSAWEQFRGPQVEWDKNRPSVRIKMNFALLGLELFAPMVDTVNTFPMWGLPPRCIKLSKAPWSKKFYGSCYVYYEITFEFDINVTSSGASGFDHDILDEGTKVLNGHWGRGGAGTGLTINILTVGSGAGTGSGASVAGAIQTVSLVSGGSGYQANTSIVVDVTSGGGNGGQITAYTNASGVVTSVAVFRAGTGYIVTSGVTTASPQGWVIDNVNGNPPDPTNPSHFIQYKDRNGENTKVVLNGAGLPAEAIRSLPYQPPQPNGPTYMSIDSANVGNPLVPNSANSPYWVLLPNGMFSDAWSETTEYERGMLVDVVVDGQNKLYICVGEFSLSDYPPDNTGGILTPAIWTEILYGVMTYQGEWDVTTSYNVGDVVIGPSPIPITPGTTGSAGNRHVEKYDESDFMLLGIPAILA